MYRKKGGALKVTHQVRVLFSMDSHDAVPTEKPLMKPSCPLDSVNSPLTLSQNVKLFKILSIPP